MSWDTFHYNHRWWITCGGRLIGGYSANRLRPYVFPFYTPGGMLVLQEAPPDHPHHQGICAGLEIDGRDMWNAGSGDKPPHRQEMDPTAAELQPVKDAAGVRFEHQVRWTTVGGEVLLLERRSVAFSSRSELNLVTWHSTFDAAGEAATLGQTKEAGIGVRVPPHWETRLGGEIRNAEGGRGEPGCFDRRSPWLSVEGGAAGAGRAGIVLRPLSSSEACPWFTRDYGLHLYNPLRHHPVRLAAVDSLSWAMEIAAYDGARTTEDLNGWFA